MANVAVVLAMLPDCPDMEEVVLGTGGALEFARPDTLLIDASTIRPEVRAANQQIVRRDHRARRPGSDLPRGTRPRHRYRREVLEVGLLATVSPTASRMGCARQFQSGFRSACTTRTSASSPRPRGKSGWPATGRRGNSGSMVHFAHRATDPSTARAATGGRAAVRPGGQRAFPSADRHQRPGAFLPEQPKAVGPTTGHRFISTRAGKSQEGLTASGSVSPPWSVPRLRPRRRMPRPRD